MPVFQFRVEVCIFSGNIRLGDEGHFLLGEVFEGNHPPVAALEALIFFDREEHQPFAPLIPNSETIDAIKAARRGELVMVGGPENLLNEQNEDG